MMASMRSAGLFHNTISTAGPDSQAPREDPEKIIDGEKRHKWPTSHLCLLQFRKGIVRGVVLISVLMMNYDARAI